MAAGLSLAGFVTHATHTPEGGERNRELYQQWAGKCSRSFERASEEKGVELLGFFGCQGAPSPQIEVFIHNTILTDQEEWEPYLADVRQRPNAEDIANARAFAREVVARAGLAV